MSELETAFKLLAAEVASCRRFFATHEIKTIGIYPKPGTNEHAYDAMRRTNQNELAKAAVRKAMYELEAAT
jgi:hypothetical protein